ncbi:hypothetical protein ACLBVH_32610, partial [Pseudomonas aeruginosa]|uniref:hypothetical protein n=1 Tax=Pseudomonas aeruginosa TaxID=287 RepID=UPI00396997EF
AVNEVWTTISDFVDGIDWEPIVEGLKSALDFAIQLFQPWVNYIKGHIGIVLDYFTGLWDGIKQGLNGDWAGAFDTLKQTFITAIIGMAENILTAFSGMWENVKN